MFYTCTMMYLKITRKYAMSLMHKELMHIGTITREEKLNLFSKNKIVKLNIICHKKDNILCQYKIYIYIVYDIVTLVRYITLLKLCMHVS